LIDVQSCWDEGPGDFIGVQLEGCEVHLAARFGGGHSGSRLYGVIESTVQASVYVEVYVYTLETVVIIQWRLVKPASSFNPRSRTLSHPRGQRCGSPRSGGFRFQLGLGRVVLRLSGKNSRPPTGQVERGVVCLFA
jgi:hypothetical protein